MSEQLSQWVHRAAGKRVLLIGDLILDRYIYGDAERISPEAPVPVLRTVEKREAVGGAANVASCLRALGCEVACCGLVGTDRHATQLIGLLEELGADCSAVVSDADRPTTTKTRLVGLAQHRHRQQLLRVDDEDASPINPTESKSLIDAACAKLSACDVVCIEDYDKGVITSKLVRSMVEEARRAGKKVLVDPARLPDFRRYYGADILTPNRQELSIACSDTFDTLEATAVAARDLIQSICAGAMVATLDRDGSIVVEGDAPWYHAKTSPRSVYDNTGAGDAVLAMLAAASAAGAPLTDAARLANVAGGLEVERFGCVPITADEVLAELRLEDRLQNGKLRTCGDLVAELGLRRDRGETVVFTNGCFDILHAGHVDFLRRCRAEGSMLVLGLNTDASVRGLGKGDDRPINQFEHRAAVLGALECVDYVVGFDEPNPEVLIRQVRPDLLAKGEDWAGKGVVGAEFVESIGGKVVLLPLLKGLSTTSLLDRIRASGAID